MSKYCCNGSTSDDAARMGKIAKPEGVEGNMDHAQGEGGKGSAFSGAMATLNKQVARGSAAPTVGGRKMTDY